jgi:hypothetical protein
MSYETPKQESDRESNASTESEDMMTEGISHLPGYELLQEQFSSPPSSQEPSKDLLFDLLRNRRRRYVLQYLETHAGVVRLSDLADALAEWELEDGDACVTHRERKRAYVSLYQTHLPKLDDADIIDYNQPRGTIELGPGYQYVQEYLHHSHAGTLLWDRLYLSGGFVTISALGLAQFTAFPFVAVPDVGWFVLVLFVFGSIVCAHSIAARST